MPITTRQLRDATWDLVYRYDSPRTKFSTFACREMVGVTITHERKAGSRRTIITYAINKQRTDSPTQVVRWWNKIKQEQNRDY